MKPSTKQLNALLKFHKKYNHAHQQKAKNKKLYKQIYPITINQLQPAHQKRKKYRYKKLEKILFGKHLINSQKLQNLNEKMKERILQKTYKRMPAPFKEALKEQVLKLERDNTKQILHKVQKIEKENLVQNALLQNSQQPLFIIKAQQVKSRTKQNQLLRKTSFKKDQYMKKQFQNNPITKSAIQDFRRNFKESHNFGVPYNLRNKIMHGTLKNIPLSSKEYLLKKFNKSLDNRKLKANKIFKNITPVKRNIFESNISVDQLRRQQIKPNKTAQKNFKKFQRNEPKELKKL